MRLPIALLLSIIVSVQCIGEMMNMRTVAISARPGCGVKPNPNCPNTIPAPWGTKLDAAHIPPDWTCPCVADGASTGVFAGATGVPIVDNADAGGFLDVPLVGGFDAPVAMSFTDNTKELIVGERAGRLWRVNLVNGDKELIYDISQEVGYSGDRGLMDVRTAPNYAGSRLIALHYTVDPDPNDGGEPNMESAANQRVITLVDPGKGAIDPATRVTLIGPGQNDGVPICFNTHALGGLRFGSDGSLVITTGDGAHWNYDMGDWGQDSQTATYMNAPSLDSQCAAMFGDQQDVGSWRSQVFYSYGGKMLRLDPLTGDGICPGAPNANFYSTMNPWCDDSNGKSMQSRMWARGFRQPFRLTMRPFNPATDTAPGVFYVGEVGQGGYDEVNCVNKPGLNFGWPCWEGPMPMPSLRDSEYNDNPNAVYNAGCGSAGSSCGPITSTAFDEKGIRLTCPHMFHNYTTELPFMFWTRFGDRQTANQYNFGEVYYTGMGFNGATAAGLAFYTGNLYPARYKNQLFVLDYSNLWVNVFFGENDRFDHAEKFAELYNTPGPKVTLEAGPDGNICYLTLDGGEVRCFVYQLANAAPTPVPGAVDNTCAAPCSIHFTSDGTSDRENDLVYYAWDFGDGSTSNRANPIHTYQTAGIWNVTLRTTDNHGNTAVANFTTYSNNRRPKVTITSPVPNLPGNAFVYTQGEPVVFDAEADDDGTIVDWTWEYQFMHNYHYHPHIHMVNGKKTFEEAHPPDEGALERNTLRIYARATDDQGLVGEAWVLVVRPDWQTAFTPNLPPVPMFNLSGRVPPVVGQPIGFDASASTEPNMDYMLYFWDFGDGLKGEGIYTTHTYDSYSPTGYEVSLYIQDNFGAGETMKMTVFPQPDPSYTNDTYVPISMTDTLSMDVTDPNTETGTMITPDDSTTETEDIFSSTTTLVAHLVLVLIFAYVLL